MAEVIRSLTHLLEVASSRRFLAHIEPGDRGLAESLPYPFLALVGEHEMRLALLLALVNPAIGGVLLLGPRGTGKTTAIRSLVPLLPVVVRSLCPYGCLPEDIDTGGLDAICPDCAKKLGEGQPLTFQDRMRLIELPLHSELADVVGGIDERAAVHKRLQLRPGILASADRNVLFIDEVNLLAAAVADAILDAAAQGIYTVRRGPHSATYRARFILIGSMNPEEGSLRPQMADRFGLRVLIRGLTDPAERWEAYLRSRAYGINPRGMIDFYREETDLLHTEILAARERLREVELSKEVIQAGLAGVNQLGIPSLRATQALFEAARAYAAADGRLQAGLEDVRAVAPIALRKRRSDFMDKYASGQAIEDQTINKAFTELDFQTANNRQNAPRPSAHSLSVRYIFTTGFPGFQKWRDSIRSAFRFPAISPRLNGSILLSLAALGLAYFAQAILDQQKSDGIHLPLGWLSISSEDLRLGLASIIFLIASLLWAITTAGRKNDSS
jgi:magnesium chelatase subunit I